jgi:tRNA pseudouridine55 synthase
LNEENIYQSGQIILIDKPLEWTSFQVVNKMRHHIRKKYGLKKIKVGHAGTLDPLATGLLVICTGKATKRIEELQAGEKEYEVTMQLGVASPSFDLETKPEPSGEYIHITEEQIKQVLSLFLGETSQLPPMFSAVKVDGKRLYDLARKGESLELQPRTIHISKIELTYFEAPVVRFTVRCSKGTYIRSLVSDIGKLLGCGAVMTALRRTASGEHHLDDAYSLEDWLDRLNNEE